MVKCLNLLVHLLAAMLAFNCDSFSLLRRLIMNSFVKLLVDVMWPTALLTTAECIPLFGK